MNIIIKDQKENKLQTTATALLKKKAQYITKNVSSHWKGVLSVSEIYRIEKVILLDGHLNGMLIHVRGHM